MKVRPTYAHEEIPASTGTPVKARHARKKPRGVDDLLAEHNPARLVWVLYWILAAIGSTLTMSLLVGGDGRTVHAFVNPTAYWAIFGWPFECILAYNLIWRDNFHWYDSVMSISIGVIGRCGLLYVLLWIAAAD